MRRLSPKKCIATASMMLAILALSGYGYYLTLPQPRPFALLPDDAAVTARGRHIYQTHCASCHGSKLEGQKNWRERNASGRVPAPPHDESGHTWHHPDKMLFAITKYGIAKVIQMPEYQSDMPAYADKLGDTDIIAVLSWIKSQWPAEIRAHHDEINKQTPTEK